MSDFETVREALGESKGAAMSDIDEEFNALNIEVTAARQRCFDLMAEVEQLRAALEASRGWVGYSPETDEAKQRVEAVLAQGRTALGEEA